MSYSTTINATYGLCRFSHTDAAEHHAEQVYVDTIDEPLVIANPDGGTLTPRTIRIRRGRGWGIQPVLDLTDQQAIEMAKIILAHFGEASALVPHPKALTTAHSLRHNADQLVKIAELLEGPLAERPDHGWAAATRPEYDPLVRTAGDGSEQEG